VAGILPSGWPPGSRRAGGLPRAYYEVRLLDQRVPSDPADRLAFLVGATMATSEDALLPVASGTPRVVLAGAPALTRAWESVIRDRGGTAAVLDEDERSAAFRAGCRALLDAVPLADWSPARRAAMP
jgi:2-keto-3-deoxy-galactonokinase